MPYTAIVVKPEPGYTAPDNPEYIDCGVLAALLIGAGLLAALIMGKKQPPQGKA
jgi:hypothetical protein